MKKTHKLLDKLKILPLLIEIKLIYNIIIKLKHFKSVFNNSASLEGKVTPWFTYSLIRYLDHLDLSNASVLEWGSGNSTIYWSEKVRYLMSIENNKVWYEKIKKKTKNVNILEFVFAKSKKDYLTLKTFKKFDIIVIDGLYRYECAKLATNFLSEGGIIILDNSEIHLDACKALVKKGFTQIDFIGIGPINSYEWASSIFFKNNMKLNKKVEL